MAILVSGASGFLGRKLVKRLANMDKEVIALDLQISEDELCKNPNIRWIICDLANETIDLTTLPNINGVVHLAGATLGAGKDESLFLHANELTTVRLLQALTGICNKFVFASSQVVYGDVCHQAVTEDFPVSSYGSAYACSKLNSENWIRWFQLRHGGSYLILRFCGFLDGGGLVDYIIDRAIEDQPIELFSDGRVCRDYLPSSDGIDVIIKALEYKGRSSFLPVNIGSEQSVSAHTLARVVCSELDSKSPIRFLTDPAPQGDFIFSIDRARKLFQFEPSDLIKSVQQYAREKKNNKNNKKYND